VHIGMAVSGTRFISAADPSLGTIVAPISSGPTPNPVYRRVKALGKGGTVPATPAGARGSSASAVALRLLLLAGVTVGAGLAVFAGVAVLTSGGGVVGAGLLARRRTTADY
jgi:hypothetical protein